MWWGFSRDDLESVEDRVDRAAADVPPVSPNVRRILWLHNAGYSDSEIADMTRLSREYVNRHTRKEKKK